MSASHHEKGVGGAAVGHLAAQISSSHHAELGSHHHHHSVHVNHKIGRSSVAGRVSISRGSVLNDSYEALEQEHTRETTGNSSGRENTETPLVGGYDSSSLLEMRESAASRLGISIEDYEVKLAAAKMIGGFVIRDKGSVELERGSVYGAVILMPQVARTAGWPRFFVNLTVRSYIFVLVNYVVQGLLLYMIAKEETVMDLFAGQMYLCDFGAHVKDCPGHDWCIGPHGTQITPPRLYSWNTWSTRVFVKQSLEAHFPERIDDINKLVDPGEYGLESYSCRWLCCFIFMMSVMSELFLNFRMLRLLLYVPTKNEPWLELRKEDPDADTTNWLDAAEVKVAGMSLGWKIINVLVVFIPKMLLWKITAEAGVTFLMETASIEDIIVNSVALTFVLNIDEMFFELMSDAAKVMLECHADLKFYDVAQEENLPEEMIMEEHSRSQTLRNWRYTDTLALFPVKLVAVLLLTIFFVANYYLERCVYTGDGHWISKTMYLPQSSKFSAFSAYFSWSFPNPHVPEPYWTMPTPIVSAVSQ